MLKKRIIPKLLLKKSEFFDDIIVAHRSVNFTKHIPIGDYVSQSKIFQDQKADEIIIVRIDKEITDIELVEVISKLSENIFMPITLGGGINSLDQIRLFTKNGADKILINSSCQTNPKMVIKSANEFGSSTLVAGIDFRVNNGRPEVYINNGKNLVNKSLIKYAEEIYNLGIGELMLTNIDNDGLKNGLETNFSKQIIEKLKLPVIISGGCGLAEHFSSTFIETNASAISAGTFFAQRDQNFIQTRSQILNQNINIRE